MRYPIDPLPPGAATVPELRIVARRWARDNKGHPRDPQQAEDRQKKWKMKKIICLACFISVCMAARPQAARNDSLAAAIAAYPKDDTVKVGMMANLAKGLAYSDPARGLRIADSALPIAERLNFITGILNCYNVKSSLYFVRGDLKNALRADSQYLQMGQRYHNRQALTSANGLMGIIYSQKGDYSKALEFLLAALRLADTLGDKGRIAAINQNIGNIYNDLEDYDKAIDYYRKSIAITDSIVPPVPVPPALYNNIGSVLIRQGKYAEAVQYLDKGEGISRATNNQRSLAGSLNNLSDAWRRLGDNGRAFDYGVQAMSVSRRIGDKRSLSNSLINVGVAVGELPDTALTARKIAPRERFTIALSYLDSAIALATAVGDMATRTEAYRNLSDVEEKQKNYPAAIAALREYNSLHDTIVNNDNQKEITRKLIQYEFDKKAADLLLQEQVAEARLKEERWFLFGVSAGLLSLVVIGILLYRQSVQRKAANKALTEINRQLDEANKLKARFFGLLSHDLRSPIARLVSFLNLQKEAPDMLTEASAAQHRQKITQAAEDLLNTIEDLLLWSKGQMTNFRPEMSPVGTGVLFDELRGLYPENGQIKIDYLEERPLVLVTDRHYLGTILRNLTSNAIKALEGRPDGHIVWKAFEKDGKKYLSITDSGPGIPKEQQNVLFVDDAAIGTKHGLGLNFVRDFANAIGCGIKVTSAPGVGTTFILECA
jgi:signal transduction histidine kinase/Tfp pilus assembly protein PilF